jgi:hypothetical protein
MYGGAELSGDNRMFTHNSILYESNAFTMKFSGSVGISLKVSVDPAYLQRLSGSSLLNPDANSHPSGFETQI